MQLDSKESDIEQLREKLNDLQQRMDNSSVTSLQTDETDSNIAGRVNTGTKWTLLLLLLSIRNTSKCRILSERKKEKSIQIIWELHGKTLNIGGVFFLVGARSQPSCF